MNTKDNYLSTGVNTDILLVEDEDTVREQTAVQLRTVGFTVLTARNGEEALKIFKEHLHTNPIRVIVTDMKMPKMNGIELVKEVYNLQEQTAFIVCSAYEKLKEDLDKLPCIRRIHIKPLNIKYIIKDIITILTNREWEIIPNKSLKEQLVHKNSYEAIQKILLEVL